MDERKFNKLMDELKRKLEKESFIENPTEYIKRNFSIYDKQLLMSFYAFIMFHNNECLVSLEAENQKLKSIVNMDTIYHKNNSPSAESTYQLIPETKKEIPKNIDQFLEVIDVFDDVDEIIEFMENISPNDILYIKLQLLKRIIELRKEIYDLLKDKTPDLDNIKKLEKMLEKYVALTKKLKQAEIVQFTDEQEVEVASYVGQNQRIVFVGSDENSTYIYKDIIDRKDDKYKDIMATITKILNGTFLKSTKQIQSNKAKLFEYYNPNGIRILYIVEKNIIAICSFFDKDKTKSIKISKFYDEAINRFEKNKQYILANIDKPSFWEEQKEYIGQIYGLFEEKSLTKKRGDDYE